MADQGFSTLVRDSESAYHGQVKATPANPEAELNALLANPYTHDWAKRVIREGLKRDSVDAVVALEILAGAFRRRMEAAFAAHMEREAPLLDDVEHYQGKNLR
jgi:hypothetical protein